MGRALSEEVLYGLSPLGGQPIPNEQQFAGNMAQQVTQKVHDSRTIKGRVLDHHIQLPFRRKTTDR